MPGNRQGGAELQTLLHKEHLEQRGCKVCISDDPFHNLTAVDVVHIIRIPNELNLGYYQNCLKHQIPYFVKALYHPRFGLMNNSAKAMLCEASGVFAESPAEAELIRNACPDVKLHVTPPGPEPIFFQKRDNKRRLVHINGRYHPLKRIHEVIEVCKELNLPLVTAGFQQDLEYFERCRKLCWGEVLDAVDQRQVKNILDETKVYICNSIVEICSTSVCEAVVNGCLVLSSKEHLGNSNFTATGYQVFSSRQEMRQQLQRAYESTQGQQNTCWSISQLVDYYIEAFREATRDRIRM